MDCSRSTLPAMQPPLTAKQRRCGQIQTIKTLKSTLYR
jgi:hypothetical protein